MAAAAVDDMGDSMQCSNHPYRNNPGGICAFCLQEKLGKLVSSSFPLPIHGSSASSPSPPSSPPSFRSDAAAGLGTINGGGIVTSSSASSLSLRPTTIGTQRNDQYYYNTRRARVPVPFSLAKKKKNIMVASSDRAADIVLKRSKSTATPRRGHGHFLEADNEDFSPRKKGFWSFLYHTSLSRSSSRNKVDKITTLATSNGVSSHIVTEKDDGGDGDGDDEDDSPNRASQATAASCDRKVSRSRSVGCGSRSFSGDIFERISTGFGDCSLRRVESQREGKPKLPNNNHMKERVKCGGIFGGFIIMASSNSSSSSSSSSNWVSSSSADYQIQDHVNGKSLAHGRSKSWGWAFASPMRAFGSKPSSKDGSKRSNLAAIPSLLAARG